MSVLNEHQFEILPDENAADGFVFGIGAEVSVDKEGFDPGETGSINQDSSNDRRGVASFGRDVRSPNAWTWESFIDQTDVETAVEVLDRFSPAWALEELARIPGALTALRYRVAGRERRVYGRPRRFSAPPSNMILNGLIPVTHDFQCVDSYTYDDVESQAMILYSSSTSTGGFVLPAPMPLDTIPPIRGVGNSQIDVSGNSRSYPIIRFNGPWTNPRIETDAWSLSWDGVIPGAGWIEIDTRPWKLTVLDDSGASRADGLHRQTWLEDIWFAPQSRPEIRLDGSASSGGASALVRWRNTWTSL